jgi:hypothetical protein
MHLTVGSIALSSDSASTILKNCAPLATQGWAIFVVKDGDEIRYGLFRSVRHSLAMAAEESMCDLGGEPPIILIRNRGRLIVELASSTLNKRFTVALTTNPAEPSRLETDVATFVDSVSSDLESVRFGSYLRRLLTAILQDCHGTLLAAIENKVYDLVDAGMIDAVWPTPEISLRELHERATAVGSADALADLQGAETLLAGMINSDGIVVFGTDGTVLGYRLFLSPNDIEKASIPDKGGGRRRTFELMKIRLQTVFDAVLFKSQDGDTMCERSKK